MTESQKPIRQIRCGHVHAAIWRNVNGSGTYFVTTVERVFRPEGGDWQKTQSFGRNDLLVLAKVADQAHTIVCDLESAERSQGSPSNGNDDGSGTPPAATARAGPPRSGSDGATSAARKASRVTR